TVLTQPTYAFDFDQCLGYADVWMMAAEDGPLTNVTQGEADGAGFWRPTWSPDGARLAMLSTRGGRVGLWIWEKATKRLTKLGDRPVRSVAWLDSERLVGLVPDKEEHQLSGRAGEEAAREWAKKWSGRESTRSVLDAGVQKELLTTDLPKLA